MLVLGFYSNTFSEQEWQISLAEDKVTTSLLNNLFKDSRNDVIYFFTERPTLPVF